MSFERGRSWQGNVFHLICILPPWLPICGFVVFPLRIKKAGSFFSLDECFIEADYYWELCYCFFLVQEFFWHIWLHFFPRGGTWGDSTLAVSCRPLFVVILLPILWGLPAHLWAAVLCSTELLGCGEGPEAPLSVSAPFQVARGLAGRKPPSNQHLPLQTEKECKPRS